MFATLPERLAVVFIALDWLPSAVVELREFYSSSRFCCDEAVRLLLLEKHLIISVCFQFV